MGAVTVIPASQMPKYIRDIVAGMLIGSGLTIAYDQAAGKLTLIVTGGTGGTSALANTSPPAISGTAVSGQTLTATAGAWSAAPDTYAYQWRRAGVPINGATSLTYVLTSSDVGQQITVAVTAYKSGYTSASAVSSPVTPTAGSATTSYLLTESGAVLTTEAGDRLLVT